MEISNVCYYDAKIAKLDNWKEHNIYHEVPYHGQVCSLKETNASFVPKALLVAKGFEDNEKTTSLKNCQLVKRKFMHFNFSFILINLEIKCY